MTGEATVNYGKSFWEGKCTQIPDEAEYITITIGTVTDYFRPLQDKTFCDMLTSNTLRHGINLQILE